MKVVSEDIGMSSGIENCAVLAMKRWKNVNCSGINLGEGRFIQSVNEEGYKYLGILVKWEVCQQKMKENAKKEYLKHVYT